MAHFCTTAPRDSANVPSQQCTISRYLSDFFAQDTKYSPDVNSQRAGVATLWGSRVRPSTCLAMHRGFKLVPKRFWQRFLVHPATILNQLYIIHPAILAGCRRAVVHTVEHVECNRYQQPYTKADVRGRPQACNQEYVREDAQAWEEGRAGCAELCSSPHHRAQIQQKHGHQPTACTCTGRRHLMIPDPFPSCLVVILW